MIANKKINEYEPVRIRKARIMAGYSMQEIATLLGITRQSISQYELGRAKPSDSTIIKLSELTHLPISYFSKPPGLSGTKGAVFFRKSNKNVTKKQWEAIDEKSELLIEIYNQISEFIDFPKVNLPIIPYDINQEISLEEMDDIAQQVRSSFDIPDGPIEFLVDVLHKNGIMIANIGVDNRKIDAFSVWRNGLPFIFLGDEKSSVRTRFDLAHELGHLLLHNQFEQNDLSGKILEKLESEANRFASAFLLQTKTFFNESITTSLDRLLILKKKWKVSVSAMIHKLEDFGYYSTNQSTYIKRQMTKRNMWRKEPYDDIANYEKPYLAGDALKMLVDANMISKSEIINMWGCYPDWLEKFTYLPSGYFKCLNLQDKQDNLLYFKQ